MFLEKIELQGFKSFANRTILEFPAPQKERFSITSIVGPNGSGKSNIVDAVKWVLGEQSLKIIRGKKAEDVIFSGSAKKARLGFAQVSLYLNNEDKKAPIDYSQIIITRRVFRDGESEYLINKNQVRLFDILILLAKSNFGQKSYSIISQGKIDAIIMASPAERKDFFDEAVGIKEFQIKRDKALHKLERTEDNLNQAEILIQEIEPRLKSLTRQVKKLEKREKVQTELLDYQKVYYTRLWNDLTRNIKTLEAKQKNIELQKDSIAKNLNATKEKLEQLEKEESRTSIFSSLQFEYNKLIQKKNDLLREQTILKGRLDLELEKQGKINLAWLYRKEEEIQNKINECKKEIRDIDSRIAVLKNKIKSTENDEQKLNEQTSQLEKQLLEIKNKIKLDLTKEPLNAVSKELIVIYRDQEKILKIISETTLEHLIKKPEILEKIKESLKSIGKQIKNLTETIKEQISSIDLEEKIKISESQVWQIQQDLNRLLAQKQELLQKINDSKIEEKILLGKKELLEKELTNLNNENSRVKAEINQQKSVQTGSLDQAKFQKENEIIKQKINAIEEELIKLDDKMSKFNLEEEKKKEQLFKLEKEYQTGQHEMNQYYKILNEVKIELARLETKKEDLENEITKEMNNLKIIPADLSGVAEEIKKFGSEKLFSEIQKLKYQLELIGGIDPETVKEYQETKERFDFLSEQSKDLLKAMDSLEKIIKELDQKIQKQFDTTFNKINKEFEKYFRILFGGGKATLTKIIEEATESPEQKPAELTALTPEELAKEEAAEIEIVEKKKISRIAKFQKTSYKGIEIYACPPGKKLKGVSMLSGGERSLASLALLSAITYSNPSPFVIFDEVDAALDEANSQRMARIIQDLAVKTQFIIITHNRAIMSIADLIYGVTMGDDGVSKLLSVKLQDIDKHATRF